jgi:membrane protease YdiL (CAAX protease family)
MHGLLKSKPAWSQFIILISICLVSFFILSLVGMTLLATLSGIKLTEMGNMAKWDFSKPEVIFIIRGMQVVQFISLFLIPVFLCARLFSTNTKKYLGFKAPSNSIYFITGIGIMIVSIPLINLLGEWNRNVQFPSGMEKWMRESEKDAARSVQALLTKQTIKDLLINIACIAGLAAVGEELLFRGMAQRLLIKMFKSPWAGIIIAAILFSALHMQFYGFLPRFMLGIFLGAAYWYSGSLWVAMLGHFVYDAVLIVLAYYNPEMLNDEPSVKASSLAAAGAVSAALVTLLFLWMKKNSTETYEQVYADDAVPVKDHPFDF